MEPHLRAPRAATALPTASAHRIEGKPESKHISTSYAERLNLTTRMHNRRFTRLTNAFSKKFENHAHMVAIYAVWYNWVRIHKTLRVTPAMAGGLSKTVLDWSDIIALMDADEAEALRARRAAMLEVPHSTYGPPRLQGVLSEIAVPVC